MSISKDDWTSTAEALPPDGITVDAQDSGGNVQRLVREGNLWWFPDFSMYVYYTPQAWRAVR